jgi:hypothetical protein
MVSKGWTRPVAGSEPMPRRKRHQSKIYTESNQTDFPRIFGDFTSMQTLAIYRGLLVQNRLRKIARKRSKDPDRDG